MSAHKRKRSASCEPSLQEHIGIWIREKHITRPLYIDVPSHVNIVQFNQFLIDKKCFEMWVDPKPNYIIVQHKDTIIERDSYLKDITEITKKQPLVVEQHHPCKYCGLYGCYNYTNNFLNQARAGRRPACAWFLEITLMRTSVCVCMCVCVCVCVRPPGY